MLLRHPAATFVIALLGIIVGLHGMVTGDTARVALGSVLVAWSCIGDVERGLAQANTDLDELAEALANEQRRRVNTVAALQDRLDGTTVRDRVTVSSPFAPDGENVRSILATERYLVGKVGRDLANPPTSPA